MSDGLVDRTLKLLTTELRRRCDARELPKITDEERADWAYGQAHLSNPEVTREMAMRAVQKLKTTQRRMTMTKAEAEQNVRVAVDALAAARVAKDDASNAVAEATAAEQAAWNTYNSALNALVAMVPEA